MMSNDAQNFNILATNLSILYNYFGSLTQLFSNLSIYIFGYFKSFSYRLLIFKVI